jgi:hypothetical protein
MNFITRFFNWIGRRLNARMDRVEDAEPIQDLRNDEVGNRDAELRSLLNSHTDAGLSLGKLRNMYRLAKEKEQGLEQNKNDAADAWAAETDTTRKNLAYNKAARAAQSLADNQKWISDLETMIKTATGDLESNELNLTDYDAQTDQIDARYQVAEGRYDALAIKDALTHALEESALARRPVKSHISRVEERVAAKEGAVEARGSAVSAILRSRGHRIASQKVIVSNEANQILQEALLKASAGQNAGQSTADTKSANSQ